VTSFISFMANVVSIVRRGCNVAWNFSSPSSFPTEIGVLVSMSGLPGG
jgi:hypothetical protein